MSSSSGEVISLRDVLEVYQPEVLRYLFAGTRPNSEFAISFDLDVIKLYEDYDRCERIYFNQEHVAAKRAEKEKRIYELSQVGHVPTALPAQIPFRHLCNLLLIHGGDRDAALAAMPGFDRLEGHQTDTARQRATCAWNWITEFAPEDFRFTVVDPDTTAPVAMSDNERQAIRGLNDYVAEGLDDRSDRDVQNAIYELARTAGLEPKDFFPVLYTALVGKEQGPRLGGFLKTLGQERVTTILGRY